MFIQKPRVREAKMGKQLLIAAIRALRKPLPCQQNKGDIDDRGKAKKRKAAVGC